MAYLENIGFSEANFQLLLSLVKQQREQIVFLEKRVKDLEGRLNQDSHNSNQPPSSDRFKKKIVNLRKKTSNRPGGQPGYGGTTLEMSVDLDLQHLTDNWITIFPNVTSNLSISLTCEKLWLNITRKSSILGTSCSSTVALKNVNPLKFLNIQFNLFGMYYFKGIPMSELHNAISSCDLFFKASDFESFRDQLFSLTDLESKFETAENFILAQLELRHIDRRLPTTVSLLKNSQQLNMDELSKIICLSNRGFRKLFIQQVGLSPNYFKKIIRFNKAASYMMNNTAPSLTRIALENDYYDQSHFIKDFKQFAGITPTQFLKDKASSSDLYNYNLQDLDNFVCTSQLN